MEYAVINAEKYGQLIKGGNIGPETRGTSKGFDGYFKEDWKDGIPFVRDEAVNGIIVTDTVKTPDIRPEETREKVEISVEHTTRRGQPAKLYMGKIGDIAAQGLMTPNSGGKEVKEQLIEEIKRTVAEKARERHFQRIRQNDIE